jgi:hypothetical protein
MGNFKNNRVVVVTFAVLMVIGLMAAYIPLLLPPGGDENAALEGNDPSADNDYVARLPNNPIPVATTAITSTVPTKASLPDSLSGFQNEQRYLEDLDNLLK